jgi:hypothetical protein
MLHTVHFYPQIAPDSPNTFTAVLRNVALNNGGGKSPGTLSKMPALAISVLFSWFQWPSDLIRRPRNRLE